MKSEVDLRHVLCEMKRRWIFLLVVAVICACIFSIYSYRSTLSRINSATYASTFVINIEDSEEEQLFSMQKQDDSALRNCALIASDEVLSKVLENETVSANIPDIASLRRMLFFKSGPHGMAVNVYVQAYTQDLANTICSEIERASVDYLNASGYKANASQHTYSMGAASFANKMVNAQEYLEITPLSVPVMNKGVIIKGILAGLIIGLIIGAIIIAFAYVVRDKLLYPGEIKYTGYLLPVIEGEKKSPDYESCIQALKALFEKEDEITVFTYKTGKSLQVPDGMINPEWCKSCSITDDLSAVKTNSLSEHSKVVLALESGTVSISEIKNLKLMLEGINAKVAAILFFK